MQSIDRKLARLAREIEAAKPKGLSFAEFEKGNHPMRISATLFMTVPEDACRQIKDTAPAHTFKIGDIVRHKTMPQCCGSIVEIKGDLITFCDRIFGVLAFFSDKVELVPAVEPLATEPVADADGWIQCSEDMPDLPAGSYEWMCLGATYRPTWASLRAHIPTNAYGFFKYRLVK